MKGTCLCLKDPGEKVERVMGCQSDSSQPWPVLGREQGLLEKSAVMAGPPAGSVLHVESPRPDGYRCIKCTGLTHEPQLSVGR